MIFIRHRINTVAELSSVDIEHGAEVDVRYHEDDLILTHDPFSHQHTKPEKLVDFLKAWQHNGPLILNLKTEGVELQCIELMQQYKVKQWFFLDMSMPYFVKFSNTVETKGISGLSKHNLAVRYSEYEPIEYAMSFSGKVGWVWVDCFNSMPLNQKIIERFHDKGFKICLVSPELQGHGQEKIQQYKQYIKMGADAVCSKYFALWSKE